MTINELQKQLNKYNAHLTIQFHNIKDIHTNLLEFGLYNIALWLDNYTDSLGSHLFGIISSIKNIYTITDYNCNNKKVLKQLINEFSKTSIKDRQYKYINFSKNKQNIIKNKQLLYRSLLFNEQLKQNRAFRDDLKDVGKDKWDMLDTSKNNFDDYEDFNNPHKSVVSKTITLTLPPREIDYLKWVRKCCNKKNNNDENFGKTDKDTIQALLANDATIDWDKYHRVMQNEAQYEMEQNGQLLDIDKIINKNN